MTGQRLEKQVPLGPGAGGGAPAETGCGCRIGRVEQPAPTAAAALERAGSDSAGRRVALALLRSMDRALRVREVGPWMMAVTRDEMLLCKELAHVVRSEFPGLELDIFPDEQDPDGRGIVVIARVKPKGQTSPTAAAAALERAGSDAGGGGLDACATGGEDPGEETRA